MNKLDFYFNKLSLGLLCILIFFFNFHPIISKYLFFYKELFSLIFLILSTIYFLYNKLKFFDLFFKTKIYILLLPYLILILVFIFNTGEIDPEFVKSSTILNEDTDKNFLLLYSIRNFTVLIPIVFFFCLRGLSEYEVDRILLFLTFIGLIGSIFYQIYTTNLNNITFYHFFYNNDHYAEYNTYIPYISSLYAISLYLALKQKNIFYLIFLTICNSFFFYIIFFSSSKACILFCLLTFIYFFIIFLKKKKILAYFLTVKIITLFIFLNLMNIYHNDFKKKLLNSKNTEKNKLIEYYQLEKKKFTYPIFNKKFARLSLEARVEIYKTFLDYSKETSLKDEEFYFGIGSLSSTFSGFHNDYMRIFYRAGIFGLIAAFVPFFYFFFKFIIFSFEKYFFNNKNKKPDFVYLLTVLLGFTLYYSLFGYPREDIYQSSTIWISLVLVYGHLNSKIMLNQRIKL